MTTPLPGYFIDGEGPAVVLLHCSLSSKNQWRGLCSMVAAEYKTIAIDLYGYGDTPMPEERENFTLFDEVELVLPLLDRVLPGQAFHVVGHSYGGAVALALSHRFPERIKSLVLFEPVAFHLLEPGDPGLEPVVAMTTELDRFTAAGRPDEAARTFVDYWNGEGAFARYPSRLQNEFARRTEKLALDFKALTKTPLTAQDYARLPIPATLVAGRLSRPSSLRVTEKLSQILPASTVIWTETGHMGPVTDPDIVNPVIVSSLA